MKNSITILSGVFFTATGLYLAHGLNKAPAIGISMAVIGMVCMNTGISREVYDKKITIAK